MSDYSNAKALTLTYLTPVSFASLNGSDKEAENISSIKKISIGTEQYPYVSSQAVRRALRDQLATLGRKLSEGVVANQAKGAATTNCEPEKYIDDDLFGYMSAKKDSAKKNATKKRTSVVRVSPLIALDPYRGDLDFGTNYMSVKSGGNPNIFETEIHAGLYRGTVLIELDRVGCGDGFASELDKKEKASRVTDFIKSLKNLWSSGRQSRFLADLSPKFVAAALLNVKNPIFLESVKVSEGELNLKLLDETLSDFQGEISESVIGMRSGFFSNSPQGAVSLGDAFATVDKWINGCYS